MSPTLFLSKIVNKSIKKIAAAINSIAPLMIKSKNRQTVDNKKGKNRHFDKTYFNKPLKNKKWNIPFSAAIIKIMFLFMCVSEINGAPLRQNVVTPQIDMVKIVKDAIELLQGINFQWRKLQLARLYFPTGTNTIFPWDKYK